MKNVIQVSPIEELLNSVDEKLTKRKRKVDRQSLSIRNRMRFLKETNNFFNYSLQIILTLIAIIISIVLPAGIVASPIYSYYAFSHRLVNDVVSTLIAVNTLTFVAGTGVWYSNFKDIFATTTEGVDQFFSSIFKSEMKLFKSLYEEKYYNLVDESDFLSSQLAELSWFKDNYQYLLRSDVRNKPINKIKYWQVKKMLNQEELINVIYMLYNNNLKELKEMDIDEKEQIKQRIMYKARLVKKEADLLQKDVDVRLEKGERVKRGERYYVDDTALGNVDKKIRKLSMTR